MAKSKSASRRQTFVVILEAFSAPNQIENKQWVKANSKYAAVRVAQQLADAWAQNLIRDLTKQGYVEGKTVQARIEEVETTDWVFRLHGTASLPGTLSDRTEVMNGSPT